MEDEIDLLSEFRQLLRQPRMRVDPLNHGLTHRGQRLPVQMQRRVRPAPALLYQPEMFQLDQMLVGGFLRVAVRQRREERALGHQRLAETFRILRQFKRIALRHPGIGQSCEYAPVGLGQPGLLRGQHSRPAGSGDRLIEMAQPHLPAAFGKRERLAENTANVPGLAHRQAPQVRVFTFRVESDNRMAFTG